MEETHPSAGALLTLAPKCSRISFATNWHSSDNVEMDLDLSGILFAEDGTLLDAAYYHNLSTKSSAVRHMGDDSTGLGSEEHEDEVIHVYPKLLPAEVKTILFVVGCSTSELAPQDLSKPDRLLFSVYSSEEVYPMKDAEDGEGQVEDTEADPIVRNEVVLQRADLKSFLLIPDGEASPGGTNKFHSGNQSLIVCALARVSNGWAVQIIGQPDEHASWGYMIPALKDCLTKTPEAKPKLIRINPSEYVAISRKKEDRALEDMVRDTRLIAAVTEAEAAVEPAQSEKLRFDIGWNYWPPKKKEKRMVTNEDGEEVEEEDDTPEEEPPALEYSFLVYDGKGEKIATVDGGSTEADGLRVLGEDDLEKDLETGTGRDGIGFAVKASILLELNSMPPEARSVVIVATQFGEGGFAKVSGIHGRLVEVLPPLPDPNEAPKKPSDDDEEEEEDKPVPKPRFRDLASYHFDSKEGEDGQYSTIVVCKLYREYKHSAYWAWRNTGTSTLEEFVQGSDVKEILKEIQKQKAAKDAQEKVVENEDGDEDAKPQMNPADWQWRVRSLGLKFAGAALEDMERGILDVATYEGLRNEAGERNDKQCKAFFANGDTYFGEYVNDQKNGLGVYIFANGGAFSGEYVNGRREGQGILIFPDGSMYEGQFKNDKFEGEGTYTYADGSVYIGEWKAGKKDGQGCYWYGGFDSCLRGEWKDNYAHGVVRHETSRHQFEGIFDRGVPHGPSRFVVSAEDRLKGQKLAAAAYLLHDFGPSLQVTGTYNCPIPTDEDAPPPEEEEGENAGPRIPDPELRKKGAKFACGGPVAEQVADPLYPAKEVAVASMPIELAKRTGLLVEEAVPVEAAA